MSIFEASFLSLPLFDDSHRELAARLEEWVEKNQVSPDAFDGDDIGQRVRTAAGALADAGWMHYGVGSDDESWTGPELRSLCLIRMALAYCHDVYDYAFSSQSLAAYSIARFGTSAQKQEFVKGIREGRLVGSLAISEPLAGSTVAGISLAAQEAGSGFTLTGDKTWIGNGSIADFHCVLARNSDGPAPFSMSMFIVSGDAEHLSVEPLSLLAPRPIAALKFNACRVEADAIVGERGYGYRYALEVLERFRVTVGAAAAGFSRRALREAVDHSRTRRIGQELLFELQMTKDRLATMQLEQDASQLFWARAAWAVDTNHTSDLARLTSAAKFVGTEGAQRIVDSAVQLLGASGLVVGSWTEALYRQVRLLRIYEGTSEVQKLIVAGSIR